MSFRRTWFARSSKRRDRRPASLAEIPLTETRLVMVTGHHSARATSLRTYTLGGSHGPSLGVRRPPAPLALLRWLYSVGSAPLAPLRWLHAGRLRTRGHRHAKPHAMGCV